MKTLTIVCGMKCDLSSVKGDVLGVDRGALYCAQKGIPMIAAMGDFDSVNDEERKLIEESTEKIIKFNAIKNDTDSEAAIHFAEKEGYEKVLMYGALGGREDHNLLNIKLMTQSKIPLILIDDKHRLSFLNEGKHLIKKDGYKYLSFFVLEDLTVNLNGCFYKLDNVLVKKEDLYTTSNEILDETAEIEIKGGRIILIQCND